MLKYFQDEIIELNRELNEEKVLIILRVTTS